MRSFTIFLISLKYSLIQILMWILAISLIIGVPTILLAGFIYGIKNYPIVTVILSIIFIIIITAMYNYNDAEEELKKKEEAFKDD